MYILLTDIVLFLQQLDGFSKETMIQSPAVDLIEEQPDIISSLAHYNKKTPRSTPHSSKTHSPGQTADLIGTQLNNNIIKSDVVHDRPATLKSLQTRSIEPRRTRTTQMRSKSHVVSNSSTARVPPRTRKQSQESKESQPFNTATAKRTRYSRKERK